MIGDTLTYKNLLAIKGEMSKIKEVDRSDNFKAYYKEILERLEVEKSKRDMLAKNQ